MAPIAAFGMPVLIPKGPCTLQDPLGGWRRAPVQCAQSQFSADNRVLPQACQTSTPSPNTVFFLPLVRFSENKYKLIYSPRGQ